MRKSVVYATILLAVSRAVLGDCLTSQQLASFDLVATEGLQDGTDASICKNIYAKSGFCATYESVKAAIKAIKEKVTKEQMEKMNKVAGMVEKIEKGFKGVAKKAKGDQQATATSETNTTAGTNGGTTTTSTNSGTTASTRLLQGPIGGQAGGGAGGQVGGAGGPIGGSAGGQVNVQAGGQTGGQQGGPQGGQQSGPQGGQQGGPQGGQQGGPQGGQQRDQRKVDRQRLNLNNENVQKMDRLEKKLEAKGDFMKPMRDKGKRRDCFQAQFKLLIGSMCTLSSGAASTYAEINASGEIISIAVGFEAADQVIKHCMDLVIQTCDLVDIQETVTVAVNDASIVQEARTKPDFCSDTAALQACAKDIANCSNDLKKKILDQGFAPFGYKLSDSINTEVVETATEVLENSLEVSATATATTTTSTSGLATRRLATSSQSMNYDTKTEGAPVATVSEDSNISSESVEDEVVEVPTNLKSAALLSAALALLSFLAVA